MPKTVKGLAGKKPPEPGAGHDDVEDWFATVMPQVQPIVRSVDEMIRAVIFGLHYAVKRQRAFYGLPDLGWIIEVAPYHVSANVLFFGGADFDDPPPLGEVDRTRYLKITSLDEIQTTYLRAWIEQAARTPGWA